MCPETIEVLMTLRAVTRYFRMFALNVFKLRKNELIGLKNQLSSYFIRDLPSTLKVLLIQNLHENSDIFF